MIANEHQYQITRERVEQMASRLAELTEAEASDPDLATARAGAATILATLRREVAMWDAGIREPVPGVPDLLDPTRPWATVSATIALKQAEIAQIDHAINATLDRIADWRRHRAWLETEIEQATTAHTATPA